MNLVNTFLAETNFCKNCGTQRCDCSEEWVKGCGHYREWLANNIDKACNNIIINYVPPLIES